MTFNGSYGQKGSMWPHRGLPYLHMVKWSIGLIYKGNSGKSSTRERKRHDPQQPKQGLGRGRTWQGGGLECDVS